MEHTPSESIVLRLKWRQTWPDRENDFTAEAPTYQGPVGRIYRHDFGPQQGLWFWAFQAFGHDISHNIGKVSGVEPSAREAAHQVEDAWFAAIKGSRHDVPAPSANAYAARQRPLKSRDPSIRRHRESRSMTPSSALES